MTQTYVGAALALIELRGMASDELRRHSAVEVGWMHLDWPEQTANERCERYGELVRRLTH